MTNECCWTELFMVACSDLQVSQRITASSKTLCRHSYQTRKKTTLARNHFAKIPFLLFEPHCGPWLLGGRSPANRSLFETAPPSKNIPRVQAFSSHPLFLYIYLSLFFSLSPIKAHSSVSALFQLADPPGRSCSLCSGYLWYCWYLSCTQVQR